MSSTTFETQLCLSRPYLTKGQLQRAQKNMIGDIRAYNQKRLVITKYLSDICIQLKFPRRTLETAVYFYQRYHVFNRFETEMCHTVATSSLLLSCKQVETIKKTNEICSASLRLRNVVKITPDIIDSFKKRVFQIELKILEACSFDYRVNKDVHIDEYIVKLGKHLSLGYQICYLAWLIAYDVLKTEVILIVPQHCIALAVLKVATELSGKQDWSDEIYKELSTDQTMVNEAYFDILDFYINTFALCDLKEHLPASLSTVGVDTFMHLKKKSADLMPGSNWGLAEKSTHQIESDKYITTPRDYSIHECRYILAPELLRDEIPNFEQNKKMKLK